MVPACFARQRLCGQFDERAAAIRSTDRAVSSSAGKNNSSASSESITSTGVPNTVVMLKKESGPARRLDLERHHDFMFEPGHLDRRAGRRRVVADFAEKIDQHGVRRKLDLPAQAKQKMRAPLAEI